MFGGVDNDRGRTRNAEDKQEWALLAIKRDSLGSIVDPGEALVETKARQWSGLEGHDHDKHVCLWSRLARNWKVGGARKKNERTVKILVGGSDNSLDITDIQR